MTSRFECLPMVLLEASSFGIPLIAFDCPTGPADIIHNNENGFLVPLEEIEQMANAISVLMSNAEKRKQMGTAAQESSARYSPGRIYDLWKKLFGEN
jgi:amylovoran biosynthesis glycosyltransferase AmsD